MVLVVLALASRAALASAGAPAAISVVADPVLDPAVSERLQRFEQMIAAAPEDLEVAADYRQLAIAAEAFDRSIDFFEGLVKRGAAGPNLQMSLALALVDKIPTTSEFRRIGLGNDALSALTKSIAQRPAVLAYYIRGRVFLHFDRFPLNRMDKGIADLTQALSMATSESPPALVAAVYMTLGDGYFKMKQPTKAREVWSAGAAKFPQDAALTARLEREGNALREIVGAALASGRRSDTSLAGALPVR
jgi:hypothetical protein